MSPAERKQDMTALVYDPATSALAVARAAVPSLIAFMLGLRADMEQSASGASSANVMRDRQLVAFLGAAAGGDSRAFESFYNATSGHTLAVVRRITGDAHAEDVMSDCYLQAWRSAGQFDAGRGSPLAWLLTMARSRALDRLRQETLRHGGLAGAPEFDPDDTEPNLAPGPEQLLETVETSSQLHNALSQLSANERWVLGLAFFRDCSQSEISDLTDLPLGTVKSLITRAQQKLRESLQQHPGDSAPPGSRH
jgi:RNA polymerase sigma-70 factor, ECF subfamily